MIRPEDVPTLDAEAVPECLLIVVKVPKSQRLSQAKVAEIMEHLDDFAERYHLPPFLLVDEGWQVEAVKVPEPGDG